MTSDESAGPDRPGSSATSGPAGSILDAALEAFRGGAHRKDGVIPGPHAGPHAGPPVGPPADPDPGPMAPSPRGHRAGLLASTSRGARREALTLMLSTGLEGDEIESVCRVLVTDPDPEVRWMAAEALAGAREPVPISVARRALRDPQDRVRAAAVRMAARHGADAAGLIVPLVTDRRWPVTQSAALSELSGLATTHPLHDRDLEALLDGVARLDPPPLRSERPGFEAIARGVGPGRLINELGRGDPHRLGAARLLAAEASPSALLAVAGLSADPSEEVRLVAATAVHLIGLYRIPGDHEVPGASPTRPATPIGPAAVEAALLDVDDPTDHDLIGSLGRALADPDEAVRSQAAEALRRLPPEVPTAWAAQAIEEGTAEAAAQAAGLVELLAMASCDGPLLRRASSLPAEGRSPYLAALATIQTDPQALAGLVGAVDPAHRQEAVRLAWQVGGRSIVPHLSGLLADSAGAVRMAVLEVLGESGHPTAVSVAQDLLANDSSAAVRASAVHVLARAEEPVRLAALSRALADPDPDVRATAVDALPKGVGGAMADLLLPALHDEDERVWQGTLVHLAAVPPRDLPVLWAALRDSPGEKREELIRSIERSDPHRLAALAVQNARGREPSERALAVELAARAGIPEGASAVAAALRDPDPIVRRTAAAAMSTLRSPAAVGSLAGALSDPQVEVRVEAVRALGMIDDDGVPPVLISALKDPEIRVRDMAAGALARWHSPAVSRMLAGALISPDLRRAAGEVLERMGHAAVEPLMEMATGEDVEAAAAAGSLLERIAGASTFAGELGSVDIGERLRAVQVLGVIGGPEAIHALIGALNDPEVKVRSRAAAFLGSLGDPSAVKPLRRMFLSDPVGEAAAAAEAALRALGNVPPGGNDVQIVEDVPEDLPGPTRE